MKFPVRDHKRDLEILHLRDNQHWTFTAIGKKYDITKGRARQLYDRIKSERLEEDKVNRKMGVA